MIRITERDLILPALWCLSKSTNKTMSTTELQKCLRNLLKPTGEDLEILSGRRDDKFSQKVRNLKSHKTLQKLNLALYKSVLVNGYWTITEQGEILLEDNYLLMEYIISSNFDYMSSKDALSKINTNIENNIIKRRKSIVFDENMVIQEGEEYEILDERRRRSKTLRDRAMEYYSINNSIFCQVCKFNFELIYGDLGKNFIEFHHIKPLFSYDDEDFDQSISTALQNIVPLCSNCHSMIHRYRDKIISVEELRQILRNQE